MKNALRKILLSHSELIEQRQISLSFKDEKGLGSYSAILNSSKYVGGIIYWPEGLFEIEFINCETRDGFIFETKNFETEAELDTYLVELLTSRLW